MNKILQNFKEKALARSGIMLFKKEDAINIIKECKKEKITVLGIDGFFIGEHTTQPSMEHSTDYSDSTDRERDYDKAIDFLKDQDEVMWFEIVTADRDKT